MRHRLLIDALSLLAAGVLASTNASAGEARGTTAVSAAAGGRGGLLVGNKSAASVWRLDLEDGTRVAEAATGQGPHEIAVAPDGRIAVVSDYGAAGMPGNTLTVLDLRGGPTRRIDLGANTRPHGMRFLPGSTRLVATTEGSQALVVVDVAAGRVERVIDVGPGLGHMVALSADGDVAYVTKLGAGRVARVDLGADTGNTREAAAGEGAEGVEVARDGTVWIGNREDDSVTVHDPDSLAVIDTLHSPGFPIRVTFSHDGRHALVTNARAATLTVFDAATRRHVATVDLAPEGVEARDTLLGRAPLPIGAIADPAGGRVFVAISGADRIAVVDTATWSVTGYWETGREPDALGFVPPRNHVVD